MPVSMPEIEITPDRVRLHLGKVRNPEGFEPLIAPALSLADELLEPAVAWGEYLVTDIDEEKGTLGLFDHEKNRQVVLQVGPRVNLLSPAKKCHLSAITIGPALEDKVAELSMGGHMLRGWMLDTVGVIAIEKVREYMRRVLQQRVAELGWGLGPIMQPGSLSGWSLEGQRGLFSLIPADEIGLRLNGKCVMVPQKSVSGLVGMGEGYGTSRVECLCEECSRRTCPWRKNRKYASVGGYLRTGS